MTSILVPLIPSLFFSLQICEKETNCTSCDETVHFPYEVSQERQEVRITVPIENGKGVTETLAQCEVLDERNWNCRGSRSFYEAKNGLVTLTDPLSPSRRFEFCPLAKTR